MISPRILTLCSLLAAASLAHAQAPGSGSNFVAALTISLTAPGTMAKDPDTGKTYPASHGSAGPSYSNEWTIDKEKPDGTPISSEAHTEQSSKIITQKYSNREILLDLMNAGVIPKLGREPHLAGWSLVMISDQFEENSDLYARHKDGLNVLLKEHVPLPEPESGASAQDTKYKKVEKTVFKDDGDIETVTESDVYKYKKPVVFSWLNKMFGRGMLSGGSKLTFLIQRDEMGTTKVPLYLPAASRIPTLVGEYFLTSEDEAPQIGVLEGSISTQPGKAIPDITSILAPEAQ